VIVFLGAAALAVAVPPGLTCASLDHPEGMRCAEGRLDFDDHGPFVSVHIDRRLPPRIGILLIGAVVATTLYAGSRVITDAGS
jgi:hypothetical protein